MKVYYPCSFILLFAICAVTSCIGGQAEIDSWGPITNQLRMSITAEGDQYQIATSRPVKLLIRLANLSSNKTFHYYQPGVVEMTSALGFQVISPSGRDVSPKIQEQLHGSGQFVQIRPGQVWELRFNLSDLCRFGEIGTYRIKATCLLGHWTDREGKSSEGVQLNSNPLDVSMKGEQ
jgi:hypothetical protein